MLAVLFNLGANRFAIASRTVVEILPLVALTPIPQCPEFVAGQFDFRGTVVPVIDLRQLVQSKPCAPLLGTRILLVNYTSGNDTHLLGLMAENVTEVRQLDESEAIAPPVHTEGTRYMGPILAGDREMIQFVKMEELLTQEAQDILFVPR
jgi:chemotaxis-related protein WspB